MGYLAFIPIMSKAPAGLSTEPVNQLFLCSKALSYHHLKRKRPYLMVEPINPGCKFAVMDGKDVLEEFSRGCIAFLHGILLADIPEPFLPDVLNMKTGNGFPAR